MTSRRILYAGDDAGLPAHLRDGLRGLDCFVVRSLVNIARPLLRSDIGYALLLFDETAEGVELQGFARALPHREHTPVFLVRKSGDLGRLLDSIRRRLGATRVP